jgi:CheY-like chemotaxis protein
LARKILLADDSVTAQNMGRKILTDAGYEVVTVNNGSAALKKILELKPDLIVLDVYMPGYSGLEVCQRIKENKETARIPILLTVGKLEPFKPEEARRARADAFVVKPFEASELLAALTRLEDKIIPQAEPYKQGRFAKAVAAVDPAADADDKDESWKARLRIPTGPPKAQSVELPEVDYATTQGRGFRDLNEDSGKKQKSKTTVPKSTFARDTTFERPLPAGLPADITPEEIAAITAAAARLEGRAVPAEEPSEAASPAEPEALAASEVPAEEPAPVTFASAPELQNENEAESEAEAEAASAEPEVAREAQAGSRQNEAAEAKTDVPAPAESVEVAPVEILADEPAPSEPIPTLEAPQAEPQAIESAALEAAAVGEARAPEIAPPAEEPNPVPASTAEPVAAQAEAAAPAASTPTLQPADDEVMAALQSLMPVIESTSDPVPAGEPNEGLPPALAAVIAQLDAADLKAHSAGPRWIAEEVALAPDEISLSLERQMEQAYAAVAASDNLRASVAAPPVESGAADAVATAEPPLSEPAPVPESPTGAAQIIQAPAAYAMAASASDAGVVITGTPVSIQEIAVSQAERSQQHREPETAAVVEESVPVSDASPAVAEAVTEEAPGGVSAEAPAPVDTQIARGEEEMVANWKNIRDSIATGGAAKTAPAKEKEEVRPVAPEKSEAEPSAAVAVESHAPSASDPKAIASIVDSVLAELRPKIVEEIARKLADPKRD